LRRKKGGKKEGEENEKEGRKEGRKGKSQIQTSKEKCKLQKNIIFFSISFQNPSFFFEMKLRPY
jgi:hypothetical protein